ncbi:MAG: protein TolR [Gammaproteobacteria bacterium CG22_combo_CG10-13_8_21_14_all_40_8]|nr:MAG: protein TolR [Gammaproteobacteria bacterium CG22_combo_CG10-13_8_21_14_all_40_8]
MELKKRRKPVSEINVVPYIDVMLVLLVIFMITAPLITAGVKVDLPQAEGEPLSTDAETPLIASINKDGHYFLTVGDTQDQAISLGQLVTLVKAHRQVSPKVAVYVNGDKTIPYGQVVELFVALQQSGVDNTSLMVEPGESKK